MSLNKINIALLLGDPSGIGPELVSKLLSEDITNKANIVLKWKSTTNLKDLIKILYKDVINEKNFNP